MLRSRRPLLLSAAALLLLLMLLMSAERSEAAVYRTEASIEVDTDGNVDVFCTLVWGGDTVTVRQQTVYVPVDVTPPDCLQCGPCDYSGMECIQLFRACPSHG